MPEPWRIRTSKPTRGSKSKGDLGTVLRAWMNGTDVAPRPLRAPRPAPRPAPPPPAAALLPTRRAKKVGGFSLEGLRDSTRDVYQRDWNRFATWCKANRVKPLPCTPQNLIRYLDHRAADTTRATIDHELVTISRTHRAAGEDSPRLHPLVRRWIRNFRDNPRRPQNTAPPIQDAQLNAMVVRLHALAQVEHGDNGQRRRRMTALRDRAVIVIGKAAALHRLDFLKLTRADVKVSRAGLELTLRRAALRGGTTKITLARVTPTLLCPVDAWQTWHAAAPADRSAPALPQITLNRPGNKPVNATDICIAIKRALRAVGVDPAPYTEESLLTV